MTADEERLADLYEELAEATRRRDEIILLPYISMIDVLQAQADVDVIGEDILTLGGELP